MYFSALVQHLYPHGHGRKKLLRFLRRCAGRMTVGRSASGRDLVLDRANYIDHQVLLYGGYEADLIAALVARAKTMGASLIVDVGANIGLYTLVMATVPTIARIVAFEPDPRNFAQLAGNLFLNELSDRVEFHRMALSDQNGEATFHVQRGERDLISGQSRFAAGGDDFRPIAVTTRRFDDMIDIRGATAVVKIDVEGHEACVLDGMALFFRDNRALVQIEIFPENVERVHGQLARLGLEGAGRMGASGNDYWYASKA
jgi:FkbM family methyltransferase